MNKYTYAVLIVVLLINGIRYLGYLLQGEFNLYYCMMLLLNILGIAFSLYSYTQWKTNKKESKT
ncbi:hypothetical protein [Alkalihalobacillus sp. LMS39]|uniref:hypothetical protein n=1 Tax=Alkalihalobacillus sp. LMS39 TaxID=2924032 RepID=UPI001FB1C5B0|nr:hypothetical protein [Alkalihalobacillus sp. LMS39]UOE96160.1 hypothetical protein MM271_11395 [Alkalihalobacillus sp. LMS39]